MTNECVAHGKSCPVLNCYGRKPANEKPRSLQRAALSLAALQPIHFHTVPCGAGSVENRANAWSAVTCRGCLLEQPLSAQQRSGVVEYRIPENVAQRDAELAAQDRAGRLRAQIVEERAIQARMSRMITELWEMREASRRRVSQLEKEISETS